MRRMMMMEIKKIIFNKYYFYPPKYAFIKSLLSLSKCGLCITSRILVPLEQYCDFVFHLSSKQYVFRKYENTPVLHLALLVQMDRSTQPLNPDFYNKPNVFQDLEYHPD